MRTVYTSIIPPKETLVSECLFHEQQYQSLQASFHMEEWASQNDCDEADWHLREWIKLRKVLDALYPGW